MKDTKLFTVATAHLDTVWRWSLAKTIEEYLIDTISKNFCLFENYDNYRFNFEGAFRYELIEEYYPNLFKDIQKYAKLKKWNPIGAEYENGDVNIPSPEAVIRNILIGNNYFEKNFGITNNELFLPDCFGFNLALPTIMKHCNIKGFVTQKIAYGCCTELPFKFGIWKGVDSSEVYAVTDAGSYKHSFDQIQTDESVYEKIADNYNKSSIPFALHLYGTGDKGGAPDEKSVWSVNDEIQRNKTNATKVFSSTPDEFFEEIDSLNDNDKKMLPKYDGEFLMTSHGVGCYTSRCILKYLNRKCETIADATERSLVFSNILNGLPYPKSNMNTAWKKIITHHFHDDITGTSTMEVVNDSIADYYSAISMMKNELLASAKSMAETADTSFCDDCAIIVFNPTQFERYETIETAVKIKHNANYIKVFDSNNTELKSQVISKKGKNFKIAFSAKLKPLSYTAFSVVPSEIPCKTESDLKVTNHSLENSKYLVRFNKNGDIASVFDKKLQKEILKKPIKIALMKDNGDLAYPSWEIAKSDIDKEPVAYANSPVFEIAEKGVAKISIKISRSLDYATKIVQTVSLSSESEYIEINNFVNWQSRRSMLKTEFSFNAENYYATYDLGAGTVKRSTNTENLYEVPAQKWADLTNLNNDYGVSVISKDKTGWDKPDNSTLRLTCIHTPAGAYTKESRQDLQDIGKNTYSFAIYSHENDAQNGVSKTAENFCQKPIAFQTTSKSKGIGKSEIEFLSISNDNVILRALKMSENDNSIILRVNETAGKSHDNVKISFNFELLNACETDGVEKAKHNINFDKNSICINIKPFEIKTFKLNFKTQKEQKSNEYTYLNLDFNADGVTKNSERRRTILAASGCSLPYEQFPKEITAGLSKFQLADKDSMRTVLIPHGEEFEMPNGTNSILILGASMAKDKELCFYTDNLERKVTFYDFSEPIGQCDMEALNQKAYVKDATLGIEFSHTHHPLDDNFNHKVRFFIYEIEVNKQKTLKLTDDNRTVILAITAVKKSSSIKLTSNLTDDFEKNFEETEIALGEKLIDNLDNVTIRFGKIKKQKNKNKNNGWKKNNIISNIIQSYTEKD